MVNPIDPSPLRWLVVSVAITGAGCGLTVTNDRPAYEQLDEKEQDAVQIILQELRAFNGEVARRVPPRNIENVLDPEKISVSFEGLIFSWTIGDEIIHVSTWENLTSTQRELVQTWFSTTPEQAEDWYKTFFYRFMAVVQGAKQYMYNALTASWVFSHRSLYAMERDSIETALSHFEAVGRRGEMWGFVHTMCAPMRAQYDEAYGDLFTKEYIKEHFREIATPEDPTLYMYFICRWIAWGEKDLAACGYDLTKMLRWLDDLDADIVL